MHCQFSPTNYKGAIMEPRSLKPKHYKLILCSQFEVIHKTMNQMRQLLDQATQFSRDIDMKFGESKSASTIIKKEIIEQVELTVINNIIKNSMETGACYKYLGQDENICYVGPINKDS